MSAVQERLPIAPSRPRRQDILSFRHDVATIRGLCRDCQRSFRSVSIVRRHQATLCPGCIGERLDHLAADAL